MDRLLTIGTGGQHFCRATLYKVVIILITVVGALFGIANAAYCNTHLWSSKLWFIHFSTSFWVCTSPSLKGCKRAQGDQRRHQGVSVVLLIKRFSCSSRSVSTIFLPSHTKKTSTTEFVETCSQNVLFSHSWPWKSSLFTRGKKIDKHSWATRWAFVTHKIFYVQAHTHKDNTSWHDLFSAMTWIHAL